MARSIQAEQMQTSLRAKLIGGNIDVFSMATDEVGVL